MKTLIIATLMTLGLSSVGFAGEVGEKANTSCREHVNSSRLTVATPATDLNVRTDDTVGTPR
jgi:hypothetical protein